ncbi:hypothetical protein DSO57_1001553 [Entomophthora muscae]|uniref:Uncharacterized protein n=1 Tax=Entomophthora muscae TaxID=34485 RepID=A0ACC2RP20_9FUNG|nr:hypothetical protein DSO57_1001553 [Entomophthora muscae]
MKKSFLLVGLCGQAVLIAGQSELYNATTGDERAQIIDDVASKDASGQEVKCIENTNLSPETFFDDFRSLATIEATLAEWANCYPGLASFIPSIGKTYEGRDIFAFEIASEGTGKKGIWFNGGLHAREWIAPATAIYVIHRLLEEASTPRVKKLLDGFDFYFTPLANPDGYEYSRLPGNRRWRKNRNDNGDGTFGVDLNRNWNVHWHTRAKQATSSEITYPGPFPHSEQEVQALANYSLAIPRGYGGIDFHSYSQFILRNWGWTKQNSSNEDVLIEISQKMQEAFQANGYRYETLKASGMYVDSGYLSDWMASEAKLVSLTVELCPDKKEDYDFEFPANSILACARGAYAASLAFSEYLAEHPDIPPTHPI